MTELQHDEAPVTGYTLSDEDMKVIENNARMFSVITSEANALAPLLMQSFPVRFKAGEYARKHNFSYSAPMGKRVECIVDWGSEAFNFKTACCFWLKDINTGREYCIQPEEFTELVTQKGLVVKMFKAWKQAKGL